MAEHANTYGNFFPDNVAPNGLPLVKLTAAEHATMFPRGKGIRGKMVYFCGTVKKASRHWNYKRRHFVIAEDKRGEVRLILYNDGVQSRSLVCGDKMNQLRRVRYYNGPTSGDGKMKRRTLAFIVRRVKESGVLGKSTGPPDWCIRCLSDEQRDDILKVLDYLRVDKLPLDVSMGEVFDEAAKLKTDGSPTLVEQIPLRDQVEVLRKERTRQAEEQRVQEEESRQASEPAPVDPKVMRIFAEVEQQLTHNLKEYKEGEIVKARSDVNAYQSMIDERDRYDLCDSGKKFWKRFLNQQKIYTEKSRP